MAQFITSMTTGMTKLKCLKIQGFCVHYDTIFAFSEPCLVSIIRFKSKENAVKFTIQKTVMFNDEAFKMRSIAYGLRLVLLTGFCESTKRTKLWVADDNLQLMASSEVDLDKPVIHSCITIQTCLYVILLMDTTFKIHVFSLFGEKIKRLEVNIKVANREAEILLE